VAGQAQPTAFLGGAGRNLVALAPNQGVVVMRGPFQRRDAHDRPYRVLSEFALAPTDR
jgi:hypothetical protein